MEDLPPYPVEVFLAVWESQSGQDGDGSGIYGQFFNSDGSKSGVEFQINSFTSGDQKLASAIELSNGNIIVSWTSDGQDGSGTGVFAKILAPHKVTLKGVKDNFSDSNGSENVSISTGLQAHINSTFQQVLQFLSIIMPLIVSEEFPLICPTKKTVYYPLCCVSRQNR